MRPLMVPACVCSAAYCAWAHCKADHSRSPHTSAAGETSSIAYAELLPGKSLIDSSFLSEGTRKPAKMHSRPWQPACCHDWAGNVHRDRVYGFGTFLNTE